MSVFNYDDAEDDDMEEDPELAAMNEQLMADALREAAHTTFDAE
jgi:hypothetical protein